MAKELNELNWIEELLPYGYLRKSMFGGFAYYVNEILILVMFEGEGERSFKNQFFNFDIWNGCLFPCEFKNHEQVKKLFPFLINHPVLKKWLYLPSQTEDFDNHVEKILKELRRKSPLFGTIPKPKKSKSVKTKNSKSSGKKIDSKIDTRMPTMFKDEPASQRLQKAEKISDLKNLGQVTERAFAKAGINSVKHFVNLGWKETLKKLVKQNPKNRHTVFTYALIGALKNIDWNRLSEKDKKEAKEFTQSLKPNKKSIKPPQKHRK